MKSIDSKFCDLKEEDSDSRKHKKLKHSRNVPGRGMRIINNWSEEEDYSDFDNIDYENSVDTTFNTSHKGK